MLKFGIPLPFNVYRSELFWYLHTILELMKVVDMKITSNLLQIGKK